MTKINAKPENKGAEDDHGLEEKMQDYHGRGGPRGGHPAKVVEGEIVSAGLSSNDELKKGRPPSSRKSGE